MSTQTTVVEHTVMDTPIGGLGLYVKDGALCGLEFPEHRTPFEVWLQRRFGAVDVKAVADPGGVVGALARYFDGDLAVLDRISVDTGGTAFQQKVWAALRTIPAGQTLSYGALAQQIGAPAAVRAVGLANGRNPVALVVPCHRVIAADGTLHGYGGGLDRKRWLLGHERAAFREGGGDAVAQRKLSFASA